MSASPQHETPERTGGPVMEAQDVPLWEALRRLVLVATRARPASARRMDLGTTDLDLLEQLAEGPLHPGEISTRLGITPPAATLAVTRMQTKGHVTREPDPLDGRRTLVRLRPSARLALYRELDPMFAEVGGAISELSDQDVATVTKFLERIANALETHADREQ